MRNQIEMPETHVVLDSNCLYDAFYGQTKLGLRCLTEMARRSQVLVYLPEVVIQEIRSQIPERVDKAGIENASKALESLKRLSPPLGPSVEALRAQLLQLRQQIEASIGSRMDEWIEACGVSIMPFEVHHATNAFNAYFRGVAPYKARKSREDIPDAFIVESIKDLALKVDQLHVVSKDARLIEALSPLANIKVHPDLQALLQSGDLPVRTDKKDEELYTWLITNRDIVESTTRSVLIEAVECKSLNVPQTQQGITDTTIEVEEISGITAMTFTNEDITPIGGRQFLFRFQVSVECVASFNTAPEEWYANTFNILGEGPGRAFFRVQLAVAARLDTQPVGKSGEPHVLPEIESLEVTALERISGARKPIVPQRRLRIEMSDEERLKEALEHERGFIFVVGRSRAKRCAAAATILGEVARKYPHHLFIGLPEALEYNHLLNIHLLDKVLSRVRRGEPATYNGFMDSEDLKCILGMEPQGVMLPVTSVNEFDAARKLADKEILVIGVSDLRSDEEFPHEYELRGSPPDVFVTAS